MTAVPRRWVSGVQVEIVGDEVLVWLRCTRCGTTLSASPELFGAGWKAIRAHLAWHAAKARSNGADRLVALGPQASRFAFALQGVTYRLEADPDAPRLLREVAGSRDLVEVAAFGPGWSVEAVLQAATADRAQVGPPLADVEWADEEV